MCNTFKNTKVTDKRFVYKDKIIRRRRQCLICGERFSTYEFYVELTKGVRNTAKTREHILNLLCGILNDIS